MFLQLDLSDGRPVYQQIRDQVVEAVALGLLPDGARLPTTRQLAADLAINFHTVSRAYDLLRQEGFVQLTRRRGAFVRVTRSGVAPDWRARLRTLLAEAWAQGMSEAEIREACGESLGEFRASRGQGGTAP